MADEEARIRKASRWPPLPAAKREFDKKAAAIAATLSSAAVAAAAVPGGGVRPSKLLRKVFSTKALKASMRPLACRALHRGPSRRRPKQRAEETWTLGLHDVVAAMAATFFVGSRTTAAAATAARRLSLNRLPVPPTGADPRPCYKRKSASAVF
ncbi:hypothetical protein Esi_0311_0004 [Ectocarpus siliculosus]|uniref:Uncharacterized protein n=1 Tax=Ectocarpus siliculosus TaxID=2880 RepID=D7FWQ6_ECTSI|nr:hypothetical protein Esi_0311_0004 [Ectocarpus siliculosus]|eukprot:CBJ32144.1 hypothetical protein Esi_0311_0004 [Ectocarpus siliculosus]